MSYRKHLQKAWDTGKSDALQGRAPVAYLLDGLDDKFVRASYDAGYDVGRDEFVRLAKEYQKAARLKL